MATYLQNDTRWEADAGRNQRSFHPVASVEQPRIQWDWVCTNFPWTSKLWKDELRLFQAHPTPLLRQASCQLSSLSGQVTFRTPEGSHSPRMVVPGKNNSRPKGAMGLSLPEPSWSSSCSGLCHTSECCSVKTHSVGNWETWAWIQLCHFLSVTLNKWPYLSKSISSPRKTGHKNRICFTGLLYDKWDWWVQILSKTVIVLGHPNCSSTYILTRVLAGRVDKRDSHFSDKEIET